MRNIWHASSDIWCPHQECVLDTFSSAGLHVINSNKVYIYLCMYVRYLICTKRSLNVFEWTTTVRRLDERSAWKHYDDDKRRQCVVGEFSTEYAKLIRKWLKFLKKSKKFAIRSIHVYCVSIDYRRRYVIIRTETRPARCIRNSITLHRCVKSPFFYPVVFYCVFHLECAVWIVDALQDVS